MINISTPANSESSWCICPTNLIKVDGAIFFKCWHLEEVLFYLNINLLLFNNTIQMSESVSVNSIFSDFPPYTFESIQDGWAGPPRKD